MLDIQRGTREEGSGGGEVKDGGNKYEER